MGKEAHDQDPNIVQYDEIIELVTSGNWKHYLVIKEAHKAHHQKEINRHVKGGDLNAAIYHLGAMESTDKELQLLQRKLDELRIKINKGGE